MPWSQNWKLSGRDSGDTVGTKMLETKRYSVGTTAGLVGLDEATTTASEVLERGFVQIV